MNWASLMLRLALGSIFLAHGAQKTLGLFSGPGIKGFTQMLSSLGFVPAGFWAYLGAYTELIGGIFLILGVLTRPSAALILILIVVATYKVHLTKGFFLANGGFEYNLLIACCCIALIIMGAGKFSLTPKL